MWFHWFIELTKHFKECSSYHHRIRSFISWYCCSYLWKSFSKNLDSIIKKFFPFCLLRKKWFVFLSSRTSPYVVERHEKEYDIESDTTRSDPVDRSRYTFSHYFFKSSRWFHKSYGNWRGGFCAMAFTQERSAVGRVILVDVIAGVFGYCLFALS